MRISMLFAVAIKELLDCEMEKLLSGTRREPGLGPDLNKPLCRKTKVVKAEKRVAKLGTCTTAAEPTEEIPYVDEASGVRGSSHPGNHRQEVDPETSND